MISNVVCLLHAPVANEKVERKRSRFNCLACKINKKITVENKFSEIKKNISEID